MGGPVATISLGSDFQESMGSYTESLKSARREHAELQKAIAKTARAGAEISPAMVARLEQSAARLDRLSVQSKKQRIDSALAGKQAREALAFDKNKTAHDHASVKSLRKLAQLNFVKQALSGDIRYAEIAAFLADDNTAAKIQKAIRPILGQKIAASAGAILGIVSGPAGIAVGAAIDAATYLHDLNAKLVKSQRENTYAFGSGGMSAGAYNSVVRDKKLALGVVETLFDEDESASLKRFQETAKFLLKKTIDETGNSIDMQSLFDVIVSKKIEDRVKALGRNLSDRELQFASEDALHEMHNKFGALSTTALGIIEDGVAEIQKKSLSRWGDKVEKNTPTALSEQLAGQQDFRDSVIGELGDIFSKPTIARRAATDASVIAAELGIDEADVQPKKHGLRAMDNVNFNAPADIEARPNFIKKYQLDVAGKYLPRDDSALIAKYSRTPKTEAELQAQADTVVAKYPPRDFSALIAKYTRTDNTDADMKLVEKYKFRSD